MTIAVTKINGIRKKKNSMKIDSIELCFENCSSVVIDGACIGDIEIRNLTQNISRTSHETVDPILACGELHMEIHPDANVFLTKDPERRGAIERISAFNDIVCVRLKLASANPKDISFPGLGSYGNVAGRSVQDFSKHGLFFFVPYVENGRFDNALQRSWISPLGYLYVSIGGDAETPFFDRKAKSDPELMALHEKELGLGLGNSLPDNLYLL